jgi:hypothetical protein
MDGEVPTLAGVLEARRRIAPHLRPTPLYAYPGLRELVGTAVYVKHENHLPTGTFKVRGGVNLVSQLDDETRGRGVVATSTGNHGQSVAYGARLSAFGRRSASPRGRTGQGRVDARPRRRGRLPGRGARAGAQSDRAESIRARAAVPEPCRGCPGICRRRCSLPGDAHDSLPGDAHDTALTKAS